MIDFTRSEIEAYYSRIGGIKPTGQYEWRAPCPVHGGKDLNFSVDIRTGLAFCHSQCARGWDVIGLEQELHGYDFPQAKESAYGITGRPKPTAAEREIEAVYDYTDENGKLLYQVVRRAGKKFAQRRPEGSGWAWSIVGVQPVPFNLATVTKSPFVAIVEGEKDAVNLTRAGVVATCNNGGALHFAPELAKWFTGKQVAILPDNDEKGRQHAAQVAAILSPVAASVKIVELPGLKPKGDVSDFLMEGGTVEEIRECYKAAPVWQPGFEFAVPDPNDKYIRTLAQEIEASGGLQEFWNLVRQYEGIETPWPQLTRYMTGGMRAGEVYVIGADQGAGKTSMGLQFITKALRKGHGVLMFSMEMEWRDVYQRLVAMEARVNLQGMYDQQVSKRPLDSGLLQGLRTYTQEFLKYPLWVSTKSSITPEYLASESERVGKKHKVDLVVIDHMQLMGTTGKVRGDYEKFTAISRTVKQVAKELKIPVLMISQTSRSHSGEHRMELEVSDLRGSGAIEEDACAVILLYQDKEDMKQRKLNGTFSQQSLVWAKLGKNRFGVQGVYLPFMHSKAHTRFDPAEICGEGY